MGDSRRVPALGLFVLGGVLVVAGIVSYYFGFSAAEEDLALPYSPEPLQLGLVISGLILAGGALSLSLALSRRRGGHQVGTPGQAR